MIVFPPAFSWKTHEKQSCLFGPQRIHEFLARDVECPRFLDAVGKKDTRTSSPQEKMWLDMPSLRTREIRPKCGCTEIVSLDAASWHLVVLALFEEVFCEPCLCVVPHIRSGVAKTLVLRNISFHIFLRPFPVFSQCFSQAWLRSNHDLKMVPQCVIEATGDLLNNPKRLEAALSVLKKTAKILGLPFYVCLLSSRVVNFKGMLTCPGLLRYFSDLQEGDFESTVTLAHNRFSTNTFPA